MKKILILFLAISLFAGCNNTTKGFDKEDKPKTGNRDKDDRDNGDEDDNSEDGGGSWSKKDKNRFLQECEDGLTGQGYSSGQSRQLCDCVVKKLEKKYSSLNDANNKGGETAGARAIQECAAGGDYGNDEDNDRGGEDDN